MAQDLLSQIYNAFDPFQPLKAGDPAYVDLRSVRGDGDVLTDLGRRVDLAKDKKTCQLYTGHRGVGKSTELLRLQEDLRSKGYFVVYFAADKEDIEPEDVEYTDVLLACTRHILEELKDCGNPETILEWVRGRLVAFKDAIPELEVDKFSAEATVPSFGWIPQFAKITASLRAVPKIRQKLRNELDAHTPSLVEALNTFIRDAKKKLPEPCDDIVVIVDNLDRITYIKRDETQGSNYDEIFIDRVEQLKSLDCHVIYTIPISMVYSTKATILEDTYKKPQVLPMIMVKDQDGNVYEAGLAKMKEIIAKRIAQIKTDGNISKALANALDSQLFENVQTLDQLCLMSGGHSRNLMQYIQKAIERTERLPIKSLAVKRAISETRDTYRNAIEPLQWEILAQVAKSKRKPNDDKHSVLLLNRSILEYCYVDDEGEMCRWYDIHPVIYGIQEFKEAWQRITAPTS
ncbi:AAA family ATPase [Pseudanabaena yagii]|uniref:AAA family ATPase n=1 Tax=Pseudanabaena yagii GIHE-NHR1 TaxID=2722753 RepID=A0ABX1LNZ6_9CYAN|nr:AAA family ATPase [Pseudanabaena yagii]NMF57842.1 AAA family ATPase [Pseudanabaena yagii GIHE-NHR1]